MAADTAAKRYSAMNITSPWRGLRAVPNVAIPQGERQAVMFMYSGILATTPAPPVVSSVSWVIDRRGRHHRHHRVHQGVTVMIQTVINFLLGGRPCVVLYPTV